MYVCMHIYIYANILVHIYIYICINININSIWAHFKGLHCSHTPGDAYAYGFSTDVLGRVLEVLCGKRLEEALADPWPWMALGWPWGGPWKSGEKDGTSIADTLW